MDHRWIDRSWDLPDPIKRPAVPLPAVVGLGDETTDSTKPFVKITGIMMLRYCPLNVAYGPLMATDVDGDLKPLNNPGFVFALQVLHLFPTEPELDGF